MNLLQSASFLDTWRSYFERGKGFVHFSFFPHACCCTHVVQQQSAATVECGAERSGEEERRFRQIPLLLSIYTTTDSPLFFSFLVFFLSESFLFYIYIFLRERSGAGRRGEEVVAADPPLLLSIHLHNHNRFSLFPFPLVFSFERLFFFFFILLFFCFFFCFFFGFLPQPADHGSHQRGWAFHHPRGDHRD